MQIYRRTLLPLLVICMVLGIFTSRANAATQDEAFIAPDAWQQPFNRIAQVACHNCYEAKYSALLVAALDSVRTLEIDFWDQRDGVSGGSAKHWFVRHNLLSGNDNNCTPRGNGENDLQACLENIKAWSDAHPGHFPITVVLDKKQEWSKASSQRTAADLDELLGNVLGNKLFTPYDLSAHIGHAAPLQTAIRGRDWPSAQALKGKIILVLNHTRNQVLSQYAEQRGLNAKLFISPVTNGANDIHGEVSGMSRQSSNFVVMNNMSKGDKRWASTAFEYSHIGRVYGDDATSFRDQLGYRIHLSAYYDFTANHDGGWRIRPF